LTLRPRKREVYVDALCFREAVEHTLKRHLAADAAFLDAAVGLTERLSTALIHLHPTGLNGMRGAQSTADVAGPHIGGEAEMAIIGHEDGFRLVRPRNGDEHRSEDFLSRETPIVGAIGEDGGHGEIALGERSGHGRHAARDKAAF